MNTIFKTAIAMTIAALSINAHAEGDSPFTYLEYSVGEIQVDDVDEGLDYSALSGSLELPMLPILSIELIDFNDADFTKIGGGTYLQFTNSTYLYGLVHYNDYSNENDNDFSLRAGFRHMFMDSNLEVKLEHTTYTDQDGLDGTELSAYYYLHPNFSVSGSYQSSDGYDIFALGAKVSF